VSAIGEALGYAAGPGDAPRRISMFEFRRDLHVRRRDRALFAGADRQNAAMRRVDDRGEVADAVHPEVRD